MYINLELIKKEGDKDNMEEEGIDRYEKTVRITPNWYYLYIVTKIPGYWSPEMKISE